MKKLKKMAVSLFLVFLLMVPFVDCSFAATGTIDVAQAGLDHSGVTKSQVKNVVKRIGHMKKKKSKRFKTAYYKGNKMIIGINSDVNPAKYHYTNIPPYSYIVNKGNKKVTIRGVRIGDSLKQVRKKYGQQKPLKIKKNVYRFGGTGGFLKCTFKKGKLKSWVFDCTATG